jgi:hypothetical protein
MDKQVVWKFVSKESFSSQKKVFDSFTIKQIGNLRRLWLDAAFDFW